MLFTCLNAGAAQVMDGIEGEPLFVDVSLRDLNTIAIEGGKVRRVEARTKNLLSGRADKVTGQAFITPLVKSHLVYWYSVKAAEPIP